MSFRPLRQRRSKNHANAVGLTPQAVTNLDWHNDMSKLILDINERIDAAADERARGVIIRRLRRAIDELD